MRYVSTRGSAPVLSFEEALLTGLARDGGLYVPETIPTLGTDELREMATMSYDPASGRELWRDGGREEALTSSTSRCGTPAGCGWGPAGTSRTWSPQISPPR